MPAATKANDCDAETGLPCSESPLFKKMEMCMPMCINCRKAVEDSLTRVAGRKMRKLRALPECSVDKCAEFLNSITDEKTRFHMAAMAWWRMSSEEAGINAERIRRIMNSCKTDEIPDASIEYLHSALKLLSKLSQEQLSSWFGHNNLYHIAELFSGGIPPVDGEHCAKCKLYRMGCTMHSMIGADNCPLWNDKFIQDVASVVIKSGTWNDPCSHVADKRSEK